MLSIHTTEVIELCGPRQGQDILRRFPEHKGSYLRLGADDLSEIECETLRRRVRQAVWPNLQQSNHPEMPDSSPEGNSSEIPKSSPQQYKKPAPARCAALDDHGPGTVLHYGIRSLTGQDVTAGCKCCRRIRLMNQRGWLWCVRNRTTILGWLREEGDKRGIAMDDATVRAAFAAAWREWRTLKQRTTNDIRNKATSTQRA